MSTQYIKLNVIRWSVGMSVRLSVGLSQLNVFLYNSYTISRIGTKIGVRADMNNGKNFLEGQGHGVKGQGQGKIGDFVEDVFGLRIMFCRLYWHQNEYICYE